MSEKETREYLGFLLGQEEYAIDILCVQEIRGYVEPTFIAEAPPFVKGVINLRGNIVPIVDLRIRFGLKNIRYTPFTVVIVLNIKERTIGVVVDNVSDVFELPEESIRPAPDFSGLFHQRYIKGLAALEERMLIVADIEALMSGEEMALFESKNAKKFSVDRGMKEENDENER